VPIFQHFSLAYVCHPLNYRTGESSQPDTGPCYSRLSCSLRSCREKLVIYFEHHCNALPRRSVCFDPPLEEEALRGAPARQQRWVWQEMRRGQGRVRAAPGLLGEEHMARERCFSKAPPGADTLPCRGVSPRLLLEWMLSEGPESFQVMLSHQETWLSMV